MGARVHRSIACNLPAILIVAAHHLAAGPRHQGKLPGQPDRSSSSSSPVILFFILIAVWHVEPANWQPFMPFGFDGVMTAAAIVFLAYVGFDAVSTTAEEANNPQRDMPIGIMGSLIIATVLYMAVSAIMTGVVPYQKLGRRRPGRPGAQRARHALGLGHHQRRRHRRHHQRPAGPAPGPAAHPFRHVPRRAPAPGPVQRPPAVQDPAT